MLLAPTVAVGVQRLVFTVQCSAFCQCQRAKLLFSLVDAEKKSADRETDRQGERELKSSRAGGCDKPVHLAATAAARVAAAAAAEAASAPVEAAAAVALQKPFGAQRARVCVSFEVRVALWQCEPAVAANKRAGIVQKLYRADDESRTLMLTLMLMLMPMPMAMLQCTNRIALHTKPLNGRRRTKAHLLLSALLSLLQLEQASAFVESLFCTLTLVLRMARIGPRGFLLLPMRKLRDKYYFNIVSIFCIGLYVY